MRRVLTLSRDKRALLKYNDALALAGFSVASPRTPAEASSLLNEREFDVVLIEESVKPEERQALIQEVRKRHPEYLICFVHSPVTRDEPLADLSVDGNNTSEQLISALGRHFQLGIEEPIAGRASSAPPRESGNN